MLTSNLIGTSEENAESDNFITIPIDFLKHSNEEVNLAELNNYFIAQLPDGTYCLLNNTSEEVLFRNISRCAYNSYLYVLVWMFTKS